MEFKAVAPGKFGVGQPSNPYPSNSPDRDSNYNNPDTDFSQPSEVTNAQLGNLHSRSDLDSSSFAQHHTLGSNPKQASPGNHSHGGTDSYKIGTGLGLVITGSRGGNAAVASIITMLKTVIEFTDITTP